MHEGVGDYLTHGVFGIFGDIDALSVADYHAGLCVAPHKGERVIDDLVDGTLEPLRV